MSMRVLVLGLRGFPNVEGGIERHAEHLYPLLAELGCDVEVLVRSPYHPSVKPCMYRGVRLTRLWSPRAGAFETIVHTLLGVLYAGIARPDVLHLHAVGPAIFTPLARVLGLRVVVTHHGADYDREKWSGFARWVLRTGEHFGMRWSNARIAISQTIQRLIERRHQRASVLIPNGVDLPELPGSSEHLAALGLARQRYVLQVSRFVREKRQLDLVRAFAEAELPGWKLALVGGLEPETDFVREVRELAEATPGVVLTGFQQGEALRELFGHAGVFVLPSSHEGLPIALLEALSFGLPVIASDIPANIEMELPQDSYFPLGDVDALAARIRQVAGADGDGHARIDRSRRWVAARYDWRDIARRTMAVYEGLVLKT
jgi:glycosyltransferase involved in cell wall biosynthesis